MRLPGSPPRSAARRPRGLRANPGSGRAPGTVSAEQGRASRPRERPSSGRGRASLLPGRPDGGPSPAERADLAGPASARAPRPPPRARSRQCGNRDAAAPRPPAALMAKEGRRRDGSSYDYFLLPLRSREEAEEVRGREIWERQDPALVVLIWEKSCKTAWPLVHLVPKPGLTMQRERRARRRFVS